MRDVMAIDFKVSATLAAEEDDVPLEAETLIRAA